MARRNPGDTKSYKINLDGDGEIYIKGSTDSAGGCAEVKITDSKGKRIVETVAKFRSRNFNNKSEDCVSRQSPLIIYNL